MATSRTKKSTPKQGGVRPRSGRKPIPEDQRRVPISCLLSPEASRILKNLVNREDRSQGEVMDQLLLRWDKDSKEPVRFR